MTRDEVKKIIRIISATYPNYKPTNLSDVVDVWAALMANDRYDEVEACLYAFIRSDRSGFAPSPGQLIAIMSKATTDDGLTEGEAWALVRSAISDGFYHSADRYAELPAPVQKAVGDSRQLKVWAEMDTDSLTVVQSNFLRAYRQVKQKGEWEASVSPAIERALTGIKDRLMIGD